MPILVSRRRVGAVLAAVLAVGAASSPAFADGPPTISAPAETSGYHTVVVSGTATPGATVELYESAYVFHDLQPSLDWASGTNDPVTTTAAADGAYRISRWVDT